MVKFLRQRTFSLSMVVLVLCAIMLLQAGLSFTVAFGRLGTAVQSETLTLFSSLWTLVRLVLLLTTIALWALNQKRRLFRFIILVNGLFTLGLVVSMFALLDVLFGVSSQVVETLIADVVLLAVVNILIFSIWYWIIDPPGVSERPRDDEAWDFLFPQRAADLPHYENWQPRYTDYLFLAFTTSFAFSPTDAPPLTRRAKLLMTLQSAISLITITAIAGSAINILASG
jgi:hypothetical protein